MTFKPKFFYESGAANEGGGGENSSGTLENTGQQNQEIPKAFLSDDELKNFGFDSPEALKTFLSKHKEESIPDEVKKAKENEEKANFLKFAADSKDEKGSPILNVEEFNQYETIKAKSDRDLVYQNFKNEFKADHPEITDEEELEEAASEDFNFEYKLKSETEAIRKKTEAKIAKEAKELRSPIESKVLTAQEKFKQNNDLRQSYPKFDKFVDTLIEKNTPSKLAVAKVKVGDNEVPIEIELTEKEQKEMRESMAKSFKTPKAFRTFMDSKPDEVEKTLDTKMQGWLFQNKKAEITQKIFDAGSGVGKAGGSNVGANNPFPLTRNAPVNFSGEETLEQSNARIGQSRKEAMQTR